MADLETIQKKIISPRNERGWAQFHDPKNLAKALFITGDCLETSSGKLTEQSYNHTFEEFKNIRVATNRHLKINKRSQENAAY